MNLNDALREFTYPLVSSTTRITLLTFYVFALIIDFAGLLGIWLGVVVVPAYFRFLIMLLEARARGEEAPTPGIEMFTLVGNVWTLFTLVPVVFAGWFGWYLGGRVSDELLFAYYVAVAFLLPAMFAVLAITHDPAQTLNPVALGRLVKHAGPAYWFAPASIILAVLIQTELDMLPVYLRLLVTIYFSFAVFSVMGGVIRERKLVDDIEIPDAIEPDAEQVAGNLEKQRTLALNHAYGFASRGNTDGALKHIAETLAADPEPLTAWSWFFEGMMHWEESYAALKFAQRYLHRLLVISEDVAAVKLLLRCKLANELFRPLPEDVPLAISAAERCGSADVVAWLSR